MHKFDVGDVVAYHGSIEEKHGNRYTVVLRPVDGQARGYVLMGEKTDDSLRNVHEDSITKVNV